MAKLNHAACVQANEIFWSRHPELNRRQLTLDEDDSIYREEWKQLYTESEQKTPSPPAPRVLPETKVSPPAAVKTSAVVSCPAVAGMTHEQKMEEAIKRSDIWPAIKDQINLPEFVGTMVATFAGLALLAATGYGALAEAIGAGLLVIGGLFAGYQIGGGLMDLQEFFEATRCDIAKTPEDIDAAAKKFSSGVAKIGVGGLFLLLGIKGAKGRGTTMKEPHESILAIEQRRIDNARLRSGQRFQEDMKNAGVTNEQIVRMDNKEVPLGFKNREQFEQFKQDLDAALKKDGLGDADIGMKGTATTFYSENPSKPFGHHWDADPQNPGDFDLNINSKEMVSKMDSAGIKTSEKYGVFKTKDVQSQFPALDDFSIKWTEELGRDVNFVGYPKPSARDATEFILKGK